MRSNFKYNEDTVKNSVIIIFNLEYK